MLQIFFLQEISFSYEIAKQKNFKKKYLASFSYPYNDILRYKIIPKKKLYLY